MARLLARWRGVGQHLHHFAVPWPIVDGRGPGRDRLVEEAGPLLDFLEKELVARRAVPAEFPVREVVMQTAMSVLVRGAAHEIRGELWSAHDQTLAMVRAMVSGWPDS